MVSMQSPQDIESLDNTRLLDLSILAGGGPAQGAPPMPTIAGGMSRRQIAALSARGAVFGNDFIQRGVRLSLAFDKDDREFAVHDRVEAHSDARVGVRRGERHVVRANGG